MVEELRLEPRLVVELVPALIPTLRSGDVTIRPIRLRDSRSLERELLDNRGWLRRWEATNPVGPVSFDVRGSIRNLLSHAREGFGLPFVIEYRGELAGQLNVSSIAYGSVSSATIGYWVSERFAGLGLTPTAVALATDHAFFTMGLHRMEICIRPENGASIRVVEKLGFRYEACGAATSTSTATGATTSASRSPSRTCRPACSAAGRTAGFPPEPAWFRRQTGDSPSDSAALSRPRSYL